MKEPERDFTAVDVRISWATLLKVLTAIVLAAAAVKLWSPLLLLLLSALLAVALSPLESWLERRGLSRGAAVALVALALFLAVAAVIVAIVPPLTKELSGVWTNLPKYRRTLEGQMERGSLLSHAVLELVDVPGSGPVKDWFGKPLQWGPAAFEALASIFVVLIVAIYLLLDGRKVTAWLLAYVPRAHRGKMSTMVPEVFEVLLSYSTGQLMTSLLFATFSFIALSLLHVPAALPLAVFAGLCDAIPVAGIFLATVPAVILGLTVSPRTSLLLLALYVCYHAFEAYVLVPRLYGNRLQLSTLTVLLAIIVGAEVAGPLGVVLALPLVAVYPVVEKHWLDAYLHPDAVADHSALRESDDTGAKDRVVDAVLNGSRHVRVKRAARASPGTGDAPARGSGESR